MPATRYARRVSETGTEQDDKSEVVLGELKVSDDGPKRRLSLSADGRGVEVEGPDELLHLVTVAAELWKLTDRPPGRTFGFGSSTLYTERAEPVDGEDG